MEDLRKVTKAELVEQIAELRAQLATQGNAKAAAPAAAPAEAGTVTVGQLVQVTGPDGVRSFGLVLEVHEAALLVASLPHAHPVDLALATVAAL